MGRVPVSAFLPSGRSGWGGHGIPGAELALRRPKVADFSPSRNYPVLRQHMGRRLPDLIRREAGACTR